MVDTTHLEDAELMEALRGAARSMLAEGGAVVGRDGLEESGWSEVLTAHERSAVTSLFDEAGRAAAQTGGVEHVVRLCLADDAPWPFSVGVPTARLQGADGGAVSAGFTGLVPAGGKGLELILVVPASSGDDERQQVQLSRASAGAEVSAVHGADPGAGWVRVDDPAASVVESYGPEASAQMVRSTQRALSYERLGGARQMLDVAIEHVSSRRQFGRQIGTYQAVQHRLVDAFVEITGATAALDATWRDDSSASMLVACLRVNGAVDAAVRHGLQVCGGMGFTDEFALAPLIRRSVQLAALVPSTADLRRRLGSCLAAGHRLPRIDDFDLPAITGEGLS